MDDRSTLDPFDRRLGEFLAWYADDVAAHAIDAGAMAHRVADRRASRRWMPVAMARWVGIAALLLLALLIALSSILVAGDRPDQPADRDPAPWVADARLPVDAAAPRRPTRIAARDQAEPVVIVRQSGTSGHTGVGGDPAGEALPIERPHLIDLAPWAARRFTGPWWRCEPDEPGCRRWGPLSGRAPFRRPDLKRPTISPLDEVAPTSRRVPVMGWGRGYALDDAGILERLPNRRLDRIRDGAPLAVDPPTDASTIPADPPDDEG